MSTETKSVHQAWADVMGDLRELAKGDRNTAPGQNYLFRGIDAVMNASGPVFRKHGVAVIPTGGSAAHRDVQTSTGKPAREATVSVEYTIYGPAGDTMPGWAPGEAMDSGDKGTPKAMSIALRTFLLQALTLPTNETEPDAQTYERAEPAPPPPSREDMAAQAAVALRDATSAEDVRLWAARVEAHQLADAPLAEQSGGGSTTLGEYAAERLQAVAA